MVDNNRIDSQVLLLPCVSRENGLIFFQAHTLDSIKHIIQPTHESNALREKDVNVALDDGKSLNNTQN